MGTGKKSVMQIYDEVQNITDSINEEMQREFDAQLLAAKRAGYNEAVRDQTHALKTVLKRHNIIVIGGGFGDLLYALEIKLNQFENATKGK